MKQNCWEFKKCGREPGGAKVGELGICKAAIDERPNGIHGGKNAGRVCWAVSGTLCKGQVQGTFAEKYHNCILCDFYDLVDTEEGNNFVKAADIDSVLK